MRLGDGRVIEEVGLGTNHVHLVAVPTQPTRSESPTWKQAIVGFHLRNPLEGYRQLTFTMLDADIVAVSPSSAWRVQYLEAQPRIMSDNGPQFIAKDFKKFIGISGVTHVRTSPHYPQSNGKIERWHKSLKGECIRPGTPLSLDDVRRLVEGYVECCNNIRLNSAIGYFTPTDMLAGRQAEIRDHEIGSWRRRVNSARFVARRPREERRAHVHVRR